MPINWHVNCVSGKIINAVIESVKSNANNLYNAISVFKLDSNN